MWQLREVDLFRVSAVQGAGNFLQTAQNFGRRAMYKAGADRTGLISRK